MLATSIKYAVTNDFVNPKFKKAYEFLKQDNIAELEAGRYEIDGDDVFANVSEYDTVPADSKNYEAHKKYFDVQFIVSGEEQMLVVPIAEASESGKFDESTDYGEYKSDSTPSQVVLTAGTYAVVGPEDAHKPGCQLGDAPSHVKKVVVKVSA